MKKEINLLFVGETWISHFTNVKGRNDYSGAELIENPGLIKLRKVFKKNGINLTHIPNHSAGREFPLSLFDLSNYDCIVLSDVGSDTLLLHPDTVNLANPQTVPNRLELIDEFTKQGGGLLMIGGWMSFTGINGKARYSMTPLRKTLPVEMLPYDDRVEHCEGIKPKVIDIDHPILQGVEKEWPNFLGYQRLIAKDNAQVLLSFPDDPLLVVSDYDNGRVAAFSSDCGPHWGPLEFLEWSSYEIFWSQLIKWLSNVNE